ncbi:hypothetical protein [Thiohalophilus sp.]|uniref:hypothetical protein n=1 Tax=Thiohalophilus sp. TaxID=3028392 RepID=UPI0039760925
MQQQARKLFWFILRRFETGKGPYNYRPLNRKILIVVGLLFGVLCLGTGYLAIGHGGLGYLLPVIVFFSIALVCLTIGLLGSDRAVANIWGNR